MWWFVAGVAFGQGLQQQAEELMDLGFDLNAVQQKVSRKAAAPSPAAAEAPRAKYEYADDEIAANAPMPSPAPPPHLPLEPNSTLRSVTVHRDQALVTRVRQIELTPGAHQVTFEGLPLGISSQGLTASVETGAARITSVELLSGSGEVDSDDRIEKIRADAKKLVDQLGDVRDRIEALLAERQFLRTAMVPPAATTGMPVTQVSNALAFVTGAEVRIAHDLREQLDQADDLGDKIGPLLIKMDDPLATGQPVKVEVDVDKGGPIDLALEYTVPGAGWTPSYSARLDPASGMVELGIFGVVTQRTGEDWTDAEIKLSTADPTGRGALVELTPWALGRSGGVGAYGALDVGVTTGAARIPTAGGSTGTVDAKMDARIEGRGAVVLAIDGKRTIRGDGSPQRLPVGTSRLQGKVAMETVPKLAAEVNRRASMTYDGAFPLLAGPISSFVGKDYVGTNTIENVVPGESLKLAFGTDDTFRVTRQLVTRQSERVGKRTRYTFRFRTVVANHGDKPATVSVLDQLPLAEDTRIEVRTLEVTPSATPTTDQQLSWTLSVPAHGEASVDLAFSVLVPDELSYAATDFEEMMK